MKVLCARGHLPTIIIVAFACGLSTVDLCLMMYSGTAALQATIHPKSQSILQITTTMPACTYLHNQTGVIERPR